MPYKDPKDKKKYLAEYYQKNKEIMDKRSYKWRDNLKKKLGAKGFKEWQREQNDKKRGYI